MNQEKQKLFSEFETEVWLYLDQDLSEERMLYWKEKINKHSELFQAIKKYEEISITFGLSNNQKMSDEKFNAMIDNVINQNVFNKKISSIIKNIFSTDKEITFGKIAFASLLIIGAITISLISNKPSPVVKIANSINSEILEWDADLVDSQISKVGNLLNVARDEDYRKFYKYNVTSNNVEKNIHLINNNIKNLKKELNSKNL
jgi:hypothetical protein